MNYANILTGEIRASLSPTLVKDDGVIQGAVLEHYLSLGWRQVVNVATATAGHRITSYSVVEASSTTCNLTIQTEVLLSAEAAALAALHKAAAKNMAELGADPTGRVLRAFMALVLQEINELRTAAGLGTYTNSQFLNALKTKVDAQS